MAQREVLAGAVLDLHTRGAESGFKKKLAAPKTMSVREAVALYGDSWRLYVGQQYARSSDLITFDGIEKVAMEFMERGVAPRVRSADLWDF